MSRILLAGTHGSRCVKVAGSGMHDAQLCAVEAYVRLPRYITISHRTARDKDGDECDANKDTLPRRGNTWSRNGLTGDWDQNEDVIVSSAQRQTGLSRAVHTQTQSTDAITNKHR